MFESDEDDFQTAHDHARWQRLMQKKHRKTPASSSSQRKRPCSVEELHPAKFPSGGKLGTSNAHAKAAAAVGSPVTAAWTPPVTPLAQSAIIDHAPQQDLGRTQHPALSAVSTAADGVNNSGTRCPAQEQAAQDVVARTAHQDDKPADWVAAAATSSQGADRSQVQPESVFLQPAASCIMLDPAAGQHRHAVEVLRDSTEHTQQRCASICPVCGACLDDITDTDAGRAAHVNACLDAAANGVAPGTTAHGVPEPVDNAGVLDAGNRSPLDLTDDDNGIANWLSGIGATEVLEQFQAADVDMSVLPHLNASDLQAMGIESSPMQVRILSAAAQLTAVPASPGCPDDVPRAQQEEVDGIGSDDADDHWQWDDCTYDDEAEVELLNGIMQPRQLPDQAADAINAMTGAEAASVGEDRQQLVQHQEKTTPVLQPMQQQTQGRHIGSSEHDPHSCITGYTRQQQDWVDTRQQGQRQVLSVKQQASDAKQQWRALFSKPSSVLAAPKPLPTKQANAKQLRLGQQDRVLTATSPNTIGKLPPQQHQQLPPQQPGECAVISKVRTADLPRWWPAWRRLPGTNIVVDCFGPSSKSIGSNRTWILTHFHADHYMGLSKGFNQGRILCTPTTAALVRMKLRVPEQNLVSIHLGQEVMVEGTRLQFIDANHCPGAAMVIARPPNGLPPVLHTGDARLTAAATQQQPALQALVGQAVLVLDTTYADPTYCFPPQQEVLDWVLRAVKAESFNPRTLFLFGSYTIGKERLFMHVASALKAKVYVAAAKRAVMGALDLRPDQSALLTTNHLEANIHVVPMRQVSLSEMESLLVRYKGRYTAVVGFQPTGWAQGGRGRGSNPGQPSRSSSSVRPSKRLQRGTVVLYQVPYSEHSSCAELREFVSWFKPISIIPSVGNDNGPKLQRMLEVVRSNGRVKGPLDAYTSRQAQPQQPRQPA